MLEKRGEFPHPALYRRAGFFLVQIALQSLDTPPAPAIRTQSRSAIKPIAAPIHNNPIGQPPRLEQPLCHHITKRCSDVIRRVLEASARHPASQDTLRGVRREGVFLDMAKDSLLQSGYLSCSVMGHGAVSFTMRLAGIRTSGTDHFFRSCCLLEAWLAR